MDERNPGAGFFGVFVLALLIQGCAIKIGPDPLQVSPPAPERRPVLRVGEITETLTGSWTQDPGAGSAIIRNYLIDALKDPKIASRFSPESSNLTVNVDLTSDHESDLPRLNSLGMLSIATIGIIPLNYFSEWNVDCRVAVAAADGGPVADYVFQERGTYRIWAFPPTMFTLAGAGIRGDQDARAVFRKVARNLAAKIADAVDRDYEKFAARVKKLEAPQETHEAPQPLVV